MKSTLIHWRIRNWLRFKSRDSLEKQFILGHLTGALFNRYLLFLVRLTLFGAFTWFKFTVLSKLFPWFSWIDLIEFIAWTSLVVGFHFGVSQAQPSQNLRRITIATASVLFMYGAWTFLSRPIAWNVFDLARLLVIFRSISQVVRRQFRSESMTYMSPWSFLLVALAEGIALAACYFLYSRTMISYEALAATLVTDFILGETALWVSARSQIKTSARAISGQTQPSLIGSGLSGIFLYSERLMVLTVLKSLHSSSVSTYFLILPLFTILLRFPVSLLKTLLAMQSNRLGNQFALSVLWRTAWFLLLPVIALGLIDDRIDDNSVLKLGAIAGVSAIALTYFWFQRFPELVVAFAMLVLYWRGHLNWFGTGFACLILVVTSTKILMFILRSNKAARSVEIRIHKHQRPASFENTC